MLLDIFDEKLHPLSVRLSVCIFFKYHNYILYLTLLLLQPFSGSWSCFSCSPSSSVLFLFPYYSFIDLHLLPHLLALIPVFCSCLFLFLLFIFFLFLLIFGFSLLYFLFSVSCSLSSPSSSSSLSSDRSPRCRWTTTSTTPSRSRSIALSGRCSARLSSPQSAPSSHWWDPPPSSSIHPSLTKMAQRHVCAYPRQPDGITNTNMSPFIRRLYHRGHLPECTHPHLNTLFGPRGKRHLNMLRQASGEENACKMRVKKKP